MKIRVGLIVLFLTNLFYSSTFAQNTYYWSGKKKIQLVVDSSHVILHTKDYASLLSSKETL